MKRSGLGRCALSIFAAAGRLRWISRQSERLARDVIVSLRMRKVLVAAATAVLLAPSMSATAGTCTPAPAPTVDDVERIVIVRCVIVRAIYPCFKARIAIEGQKIKSGAINAIMGTGLRGTYTLVSDTKAARYGELYSAYYAELLIHILDWRNFASMAAPRSGPEIDGPFNLLAVWRCGKVKVLWSDGNIDDADHIQWSVLLQQLQAAILSLDWARTGEKPDWKDVRNWFIAPSNAELLDSL
jgi:hypothetical protein